MASLTNFRRLDSSEGIKLIRVNILAVEYHSPQLACIP